MDRKDLVWLDLCSGLGGASQPALDRGWTVIRVDIDRRFKPDIVADVRALPLRAFHVDVLWASPPCQEFSKFQLRCFFPNPPEPDLTIAQSIFVAIQRLRPTTWFVENVWAARPWFNRVFGPLTNRIPGHALWSNTLVLMPNIAPHKGSFHEKHSSGKRWGIIAHTHERRVKLDKNGRKFIQRPAIAFGPKRYPPETATAAKIPYEIGEAICRAVEARRK